MRFFSQQISPEKWGIYNDAGLLATVSCQATCETILANLKSGRRDTPTGALGALYKAPQLKSKQVARDRTAFPKENRLTLTSDRRSNRPPVPKRKTRKAKVSQVTSQLTHAKETPDMAKKVIAETATEARLAQETRLAQKALDFSHRQKRQITVAQASQITLDASTQLPLVGKAERA